MTAYREEALKLAWHCSGQEFLTPKEGIEKGVPKAPSILRANYYKWFVKVGRGKYGLSEAGALAMTEYQTALQDIMAQPGMTDHPQAKQTGLTDVAPAVPACLSDAEEA